jgi:hypothetical protein
LVRKSLSSNPGRQTLKVYCDHPQIPADKEFTMKRLVATLAVVLSTALAVPAQAHGMGGWRGGYMHHYHGGWRGDWVGPVVGAAIVGSAVYAATRPAYNYGYTYASPPVAVMPPAPPVAYYCSTWGQYYPTVQTCPVPWQPVTY